MENNYLEKYLKYKDKYLQSRNLNKNQNGSGFLTEDNSINSMICKISKIPTETTAEGSAESSTESSQNLFILVSFKNGFIYNYHEEKCYLILKNENNDNSFYLFGIRNINDSLEVMNTSVEDTFIENYEKKNIYKLEREPITHISTKNKVKANRKWVIKDLNNQIKYTIENLELKPYAHKLCSKKLVIFVRHGESEANKTHLYETHPNPLSDLGVAQCEELSIDLLNFHNYLGLGKSKLNSLGNCIDYAIYSPLQRASETGEIGLSKIIDINSSVDKESANATIKKKNKNTGEEEEEDVLYHSKNVKQIRRDETSKKMTISYSENIVKEKINKELKFLCTEIIGSYSDVGNDLGNYKELFPDVKVDDIDFNQGYNLLWKNYLDIDSFEGDENNVLNNDVILEKYRPHMIHRNLLSIKNKIITVFTHSNFISNYLEYVLNIPSVFGGADLAIKSNDDEIIFSEKFKEFYPFVIRNTNIILLLID